MVAFRSMHSFTDVAGKGRAGKLAEQFLVPTCVAFEAGCHRRHHSCNSKARTGRTNVQQGYYIYACESRHHHTHASASAVVIPCARNCTGNKKITAEDQQRHVQTTRSLLSCSASSQSASQSAMREVRPLRCLHLSALSPLLRRISLIVSSQVISLALVKATAKTFPTTSAAHRAILVKLRNSAALVKLLQSSFGDSFKLFREVSSTLTFELHS